jgi:H+-transporting ATPase
MTPLGWKWAGFVWGYAIAWALVNDRIKLLAYRIFDPIKKAAPQTAAPAGNVHEIATRAYDIYQQRVQGESRQDQDWNEAEREIRLEEAAKKKSAA